MEPAGVNLKRTAARLGELYVSMGRYGYLPITFKDLPSELQPREANKAGAYHISQQVLSAAFNSKSWRPVGTEGFAESPRIKWELRGEYTREVLSLHGALAGALPTVTAEMLASAAQRLVDAKPHFTRAAEDLHRAAVEVFEKLAPSIRGLPGGIPIDSQSGGVLEPALHNDGGAPLGLALGGAPVTARWLEKSKSREILPGGVLDSAVPVDGSAPFKGTAHSSQREPLQSEIELSFALTRVRRIDIVKALGERQESMLASTATERQREAARLISMVMAYPSPQRLLVPFYLSPTLGAERSEYLIGRSVTALGWLSARVAEDRSRCWALGPCVAAAMAALGLSGFNGATEFAIAMGLALAETWFERYIVRHLDLLMWLAAAAAIPFPLMGLAALGLDAVRLGELSRRADLAAASAFWDEKSKLADEVGEDEWGMAAASGLLNMLGLVPLAGKAAKLAWRSKRGFRGSAVRGGGGPAPAAGGDPVAEMAASRGVSANTRGSGRMVDAPASRGGESVPGRAERVRPGSDPWKWDEVPPEHLRTVVGGAARGTGLGARSVTTSGAVARAVSRFHGCPGFERVAADLASANAHSAEGAAYLAQAADEFIPANAQFIRFEDRALVGGAIERRFDVTYLVPGEAGTFKLEAKSIAKKSLNHRLVYAPERMPRWYPGEVRKDLMDCALGATSQQEFLSRLEYYTYVFDGRKLGDKSEIVSALMKHFARDPVPRIKFLQSSDELEGALERLIVVWTPP